MTTRLQLERATREHDLERVSWLLEQARRRPELVALERNPPLYMDVSNVYSGDELGVVYRDLITEGVAAATDLAVTAHGGANSIDVAKGSCWVMGDTNPDLQPNYRCFNDAIVNRGITPDPTNPRRVRVVAQITDQGFSGVGRQWDLVAIHGTPAGSPTLPAEPASALSLADITVPAAAASSAVYTITDLRPRAFPMGVSGGAADGQIPIWNATTGKWQPGNSVTIYRKNTTTDIVSTVALTDILGGAVTIPGGVVKANSMIRVTILGDYLNNSGAARNFQFDIELGGTIVYKSGTGVQAGTWAADRAGLRIDFAIGFQSLSAQDVAGVLMISDINADTAAVQGAGGNPVGLADGRAVHFDFYGGTGVGAALTAIDFSTAKTLAVKIAPALNNASYSFRCHYAQVEVIV